MPESVGAALADAVRDARNFGVVADGKVDDSAALLRAAAAGIVVLPRGVTRVSRELTLDSGVLALPGARLRVEPGAVVTIGASFWAPLTQVFEGAGAVRFAQGAITIGHPEWWGARPGDPTADCAPAINACLEACPVTQLQQAPYHLHGPVRMSRSGRSLVGVNDSQTSTAPSSELVIHDSRSPALICGRDQRSNAPMTDYLTLSNLTVSRAGASYDATDLRTAPAGVKLAWCALLHAERVTVRDQSVGFNIYACVECCFVQCSAMTMAPPPQGARVCGFFLDYGAEMGLAGGNASIYFERCRAFGHGHGKPAYSAGLASLGGFCDLFISRLETGFQQFGIDLQGDGAGSASVATQDCQLADCILDSNSEAGIRIRAAGRNADIHIRGCYIALPGPLPSSTAVRLGGGRPEDAIDGTISVSDCEFIGEYAGVDADSVAVCNLSMNTHLNTSRPVRFHRVHNSDIRDSAHVAAQRRVTGPVVQLEECEGIVVSMSVSGFQGAFLGGVDVASDCSRVAIDRTRISDEAVGGVDRLVLIERRPWGGAASFGRHITISGAGPLRPGG